MKKMLCKKLIKHAPRGSCSDDANPMLQYTKICQNETKLGKNYFEDQESSGPLADEDGVFDSLLGIPPAYDEQQHGNELSTFTLILIHLTLIKVTFHILAAVQ